MQINETFYFNPDDENSLRYYEQRSIWCDKNNAKIVEIGTVDVEITEKYYDKNECEQTQVGVKTLRQFQIQPISEPTIEEKAERVRAIRNQYLSDTDKYMLLDFPITEEERNEYKAYRTYLRDITESADFPNVEVLAFEEWNDITS